ncbi:SDR family NAD(P)-dependent oxidoreductase [Planctomicrobium sp. SH527]|uniref:SDR family NAD(P)-dependent oxidoreductase n=1 Tax=Planctomicrobium sp. SH527 TaxID=3448123 RepID=UPI003F5C9941
MNCHYFLARMQGLNMTPDLSHFPLFDMAGRVAVITGAASGIGRATALTFARAGARVFTGDFDLCHETSDEFRALEIHEQLCDVRNVDDLRSLIDGAAAKAGRLDFLINNAGMNLVGQVTEIEESEWQNCMDTNLKAPFFGAKFAVPHMQKSGGGSIVNTASNAGLMPRAHDPVYSISKMALVGLTRSLALCHTVDRIRVNCVCPGPVSDTRLMDSTLACEENPDDAARRYLKSSPLAHAHGRMISPFEVASTILYLCSDAAAMVTGTAVAIDGGKSLGIPPQDNNDW